MGSAATWILLDVNRDCSDTFRAGKEANGRYSFQSYTQYSIVRYYERPVNLLPIERHENWVVLTNNAFVSNQA